MLQGLVQEWVSGLPRGFVGLIEITGVDPPVVVPQEPTEEGGLPGMYQHAIGSVLEFKVPVPASGQLGVWMPKEEDVISGVFEQHGVAEWLEERMGREVAESRTLMALSVRQPHANDILKGRKTIENRKRALHKDLGPIAKKARRHLPTTGAAMAETKADQVSA